MAVITESNKYGPATEKDVIEFENLIKARLPEDYRDFLLAHNGGHPEPDFFFISDEQGDDVIHNLSGLLKEPYYHSLFYKLNTFRDRMPPNIISFGSDPGGNQICISIYGQDCGSIYFWDHEEEVDEDEEPTYDNLYHLATSFTEFLEKLYKDSDEESN